jgi:glycosyltransferase involved in cell wall biosynthesis
MPDSGVAVILCTRDRPAFLEAALPAVAAALRDEDEAVVVDSASIDPAVRRIAEAAGFRVVRASRPGLARARNVGMAATSASLVAFTDDDCRPQTEWTARLAAHFVDPTVGFATGQVMPDRDNGPVVAVKTDREPRRFEGAQDPAPMGHGANMAMRRTALEGIGGFDEALGAGSRFRSGEDQDIFYRLLRDGWAGVYDPEASVVHEQWRGVSEAVRLWYGYGIGAGAVAMKVVRLDGRPGRRLLWKRLWNGGVLVTLRSARSGYRGGMANGVVHTAGTTVGAVRAARLPLRDGLFGGSGTSAVGS